MQAKDIENSSKINNIVKEALIEIKFTTRKDKIKWVKNFLNSVNYRKIKNKKTKGMVGEIISNITTAKERTISKWLKLYKSNNLRTRTYNRNKFHRIYLNEDIILLADVDSKVERLSAESLRNLFIREYKIFNNKDFERLSHISKSHINNLRGTSIYRTKMLKFNKTHSNKANFLPIGKMIANGKPGYIRVDSVHSGIWNEQKGLYFINMIDDVLQTEFIYTLPLISERFLVPMVEYMLSSYWTDIHAFHADGGSEYNNSLIVGLLNKIHIGSKTRNRPYHSNDNALIESKNAAIVRKHFGFGYIPKNYYQKFNIYLEEYFNPYLNFHRSSGYLTGIHKSNKGRSIREYKYYNPPYELFKEKYRMYLKEGLSIEELDKIAYKMSDYESAKLMKSNKDELFKGIFNSVSNYEVISI